MELKSWLSKIDNKSLLRKLTLIGTNDSCSYFNTNIIDKVFRRTQNKDLIKQFNIGVRYFDLILSNYKQECVISTCGKKIKLSIILSEFESLLKENPTEFLMVNIRADYSTTKLFLTEYETLSASSDIYMMNTDKNISVGELRGKIIFTNVINSNEYIENIRTRVNYNPYFPIGIEGCLLKYSEIVKFDLESQEQDERMYVNYTHSRGYFCRFITLPRLASRCINKMIYEAYSTTLKMRDAILVVDFITEDMAKIILKNNFAK